MGLVPSVLIKQFTFTWNMIHICSKQLEMQRWNNHVKENIITEFLQPEHNNMRCFCQGTRLIEKQFNLAKALWQDIKTWTAILGPDIFVPFSALSSLFHLKSSKYLSDQLTC
jgi:hypothetical protein